MCYCMGYKITYALLVIGTKLVRGGRLRQICGGIPMGSTGSAA